MLSALPLLLALSILLGLLHILFAATLVTGNRGVSWNLGARDGDPPAVTAFTARAQRAAQNFLETFPLFAAAVVCAIAIHHDGARAQLGAQLYFWARLVYLPVYLLGVPMVRTLIWTVSLAGLVMVVTALL